MTSSDASTYPWFGVTSGKQLQQGDLLPKTPRLLLPETLLQGSVDATLELTSSIVMSQSCDLATKRIDDVILCPVVYRSDIAQNPKYNTPAFWEEARQGVRYQLHILNRCEISGFENDSAMVELSKVFALPLNVVAKHADSLGERIRLLPPYREQLAQAFARFYMRVGLPIDIPRFT